MPTSGFLSTHSTTIKCTPGAPSATSFFHLQATNAPDLNGKYLWAAALSPRLVSFSIDGQFVDGLEAATAYSIDEERRLITRHKNGTMFANVDPYSHFQIVHWMERGEIRLRRYDFMRCELQPPSGRFPGGFRELYCLADGGWHRDIWNYCPIYKEWFNAGLVLADEFSPSTPPCQPVVLLAKPICGWS
jgi:hypothetical protein